MWVREGYVPEQSSPRAPEDKGQRLATFARGKGVEMRVSVAEYNGSRFLSFRQWAANQAGDWWPVKGVGCTVRLHEVGELAEALATLAGSSSAPATIPIDPSGETKYVDRRPSRRTHAPVAEILPFKPITGRIGDVNFNEPFDEFA